MADLPRAEAAGELEAHALLDVASEAEARALLLRCCGSQRWADGMLGRRPFRSASALVSAAGEVFGMLGRADYLEAFAGHPAIGENVAALSARFAATATWSGAEQAGVAAADPATLQALAAGNRSYRERFGYTFIVCATGKSAREMLELLSARLENDADTELLAAAKEQEKITLLRLGKLGAGRARGDAAP
jgi:2-oxo-4-hydroxy-4-carboxy-5-ureidoimidazoline decarboxylase